MADTTDHPSDRAILDALRGALLPLRARQVALVTGLTAQQAGQRLARLTAQGRTFRKTLITATAGCAAVEYGYTLNRAHHPAPVAAVVPHTAHAPVADSPRRTQRATGRRRVA